MTLDNPLLVRWEYAGEERFEKRHAILRSLSAFETVAEQRPPRILDVGCGTGVSPPMIEFAWACSDFIAKGPR